MCVFLDFANMPYGLKVGGPLLACNKNMSLTYTNSFQNYFVLISDFANMPYG